MHQFEHMRRFWNDPQTEVIWRKNTEKVETTYFCVSRPMMILQKVQAQ